MPAPLSQAVEDYLKTIYRLAERERPVTTTRLAQELAVAPASVTNMLKRLARLRLVRHTPYHGVELTEAGQKVALEVIRHHRLLELYLSRYLGVRLDRVHGEADRLEHALSEDLEDRIAEALGEPAVDPHGHPIPTREGAVAPAGGVVLADARAGQRGTVTRVNDRDADTVRELAAAGLVPGAPVEVVAAGRRGVEIRVEGHPRRIGPALAGEVYLALEGDRPAQDA
ncbi:MAG: metal-dependent transcriptional regulator [Armatimonadota bacterium]|nr:metal-dependent transcriptional regulator [Armatimonadota bacterium]MDR7532187.1 metal-dependent transcriptional regulator [Armatimonadota bacterium]MDR7537278.1 metal-dependent transcriptional regulator [Armatimonadota bacterium]